MATTLKRAAKKPSTVAESRHTSQGPWYVIDSEWYGEHAVSLGQVVHSRRCSSCQALARKEANRRNGNNRTGKQAKVVATSWEREMRELAGCCALKKDYLTADTPLLEAVFRTLLAEKNRPRAFEELVEEIGQRYAVGEMPKDVATTTLQRLLERQQAYGLKRLEKLAAP